MERLAARGITCEVCPTSNVGLGVAERAEDVPLRRLFEAGVPIALGADDPLLFGARLLPQYELARHVYGFSDPELAELARQSVRASAAPDNVCRKLLQGIDDWLALGGLSGRPPAPARRATYRQGVRPADRAISGSGTSRDMPAAVASGRRQRTERAISRARPSSPMPSRRRPTRPRCQMRVGPAGRGRTAASPPPLGR